MYRMCCSSIGQSNALNTCACVLHACRWLCTLHRRLIIAASFEHRLLAQLSATVQHMRGCSHLILPVLCLCRFKQAALCCFCNHRLCMACNWSASGAALTAYICAACTVCCSFHHYCHRLCTACNWSSSGAALTAYVCAACAVCCSFKHNCHRLCMACIWSASGAALTGCWAAT